MRKSYILIFLFLSFFSSSCIDDFLDRKPMDIISEDLVWNDQKAVEAYMAGMYDAVQVEPHAWLLNWGTLGHYTDESMRAYVWGFPYTPVLNIGDLHSWQYGDIRVVNDFLKNMEGSTLDNSLKNRFIAEAHFIRAFHYFTLVKRYGGVPILKESQEYNEGNIESLKVPRDKEEDVWNFIADECDLAIANLPESYGSSDQFRATKYAAAALKSRAMLYAGSISKYGSVQLDGLVGVPADKANSYFESSLKASEMIINSGKFALYNKIDDKAENFQQLFLDKSAHSEGIFTKVYSAPDKGHEFDYAMAAISYRIDWGCNTNPTLELVEAFDYTDGTPGKLKTNDENGKPIYYDKADDIFKNKDPRFFASILYPDCPWQGGTKLEIRRGIIRSDGTKEYASTLTDKFTEDPSLTISGKDGLVPQGDNTRTGFYIKKWMDPEKRLEYGYSETNFMVFRYAEILLNYAEAAFETGKTEAAREKINQVRERAGVKAKDVLTLDDVRNERRVELAFENHRYWDLVRWRIADKVMNNTTFNALIPWLDYKSKKFIFEKDVNTLNLSKTFLDKHYYLPIPGIAQNELLIQNPGY